MAKDDPKFTQFGAPIADQTSPLPFEHKKPGGLYKLLLLLALALVVGGAWYFKPLDMLLRPAMTSIHQ